MEGANTARPESRSRYRLKAHATLASGPRAWALHLVDRLSGSIQKPLDASERLALLLVGDLLALNVALVLVVSVSHSFSWSQRGLATDVGWFVLLSALWMLFAPASDCGRLAVTAHRWTNVYSTLRTGLLVVGVYVLVPHFGPPLPRSRSDLALFVLITLGLLAVWRFAYSSVARSPLVRRRVLIVGTGPGALAVSRAIRQHLDTDYEVAGFVTGRAISARSPDVRAEVIQDPKELIQLIDQLGVAELVVSEPENLSDVVAEAAIRAYERGVKVTPVATFCEAITGQVPVEYVGPYWFDALPSHATGRFPHVLVKRAMDVVGSLCGLAVTVAAFPFIALAIRLDSPGPILFHQTRVGKGGRPFTVHKFRTMPVDPDRHRQSIWARKRDRTTTTIGRALRRARLDELPQFWNILLGEMSLVGPRPYIPEEVEALQEQIPFFRTRLLATPGLTGWAQIRHGYGTSPTDELAKLKYDIYYIKHQSVYLDLLITLRTLQSMLRLTGR